MGIGRWGRTKFEASTLVRHRGHDLTVYLEKLSNIINNLLRFLHQISNYFKTFNALKFETDVI